MTFNGIIALILLYFTEFDTFAGLLRHTGIDLYYLHNIVFHFWPKLTHRALQRGLSATAELLVQSYCRNNASLIFDATRCVCVLRVYVQHLSVTTRKTSSMWLLVTQWNQRSFTCTIVWLTADRYTDTRYRLIAATTPCWTYKNQIWHEGSSVSHFIEIG